MSEIPWAKVVRARFRETGRLWWAVRAQRGRFVVCTQQVPFEPRGVLRYTVLDLDRGIRGPCNLVGQGWEGIDTDRGCRALVLAMVLGVVEVSHRNHVPTCPTEVEFTNRGETA